MLKSRNYLDWMNDLGARLNLKDISTQFISVAVAMNALVDSICDMTNKEVSEATLSRSSLPLPQIPELSFLTAVRLGRLVVHNTLFRGNTVLTKVRVKRAPRLVRVPDREHNPDR